MVSRVALCVDEVALRNPEAIGLAGERLDGLNWLAVYSRGDKARARVRESRTLEEVWVISCDGVDAINLAASLKADRPDLIVRMVSFELDGSLLSRAHTARIDEVLDRKKFIDAFCKAKERASSITVQELNRKVDSPTSEAAEEAFLLPVVSGSGGVGKSTVSALAALLCSKAGFRTLLVDCDFQFGDMAYVLGRKDAVAFDGMMHRGESLDDLPVENRLALLAAPARLEFADEAARALPNVLDAANSHFDVVIANTSVNWSESQVVLLERCSAALFLLDQRALTLRTCRHALELCARCGIASNPFQLVLNRCTKSSALTSIDASCALKGRPVFELKDGGHEVEEYMSAGCASDLLDTGNGLCSSLGELLVRLLPEGKRPAGAISVQVEAKRSSRRRQLPFMPRRKEEK